MEQLDREIYGKSTVCICPKCGRSHKLKIKFIGRGIPRKFCGACTEVLDSYSSSTASIPGRERMANILNL